MIWPLGQKSGKHFDGFLEYLRFGYTQNESNINSYTVLILKGTELRKVCIQDLAENISGSDHPGSEPAALFRISKYFSIHFWDGQKGCVQQKLPVSLCKDSYRDGRNTPHWFSKIWNQQRYKKKYNIIWTSLKVV